MGTKRGMESGVKFWEVYYAVWPLYDAVGNPREDAPVHWRLRYALGDGTKGDRSMSRHDAEMIEQHAGLEYEGPCSNEWAYRLVSRWEGERGVDAKFDGLFTGKLDTPMTQFFYRDREAPHRDEYLKTVERLADVLDIVERGRSSIPKNLHSMVDIARKVEVRQGSKPWVLLVEAVETLHEELARVSPAGYAWAEFEPGVYGWRLNALT
jgi:hypothetical protein